MRKHLITPIPQNAPPLDEGWLDLDDAAVVEITSEEKEYPVESALVSGEMRGWRAADSGTQTIRLIFDEPQRLTRISLVFEETETERTQEFVLRWSPDGGRSFREIVRQQWNFSSPKTTREVEEFQVELSDVTVLELVIVPDISRGTARASLKSLRLSLFLPVNADIPLLGSSDSPCCNLIRIFTNLLSGTLLRQSLFDPASLARLQIVGVALHVLNNVFRHNLALEAPESTFY